MTGSSDDLHLDKNIGSRIAAASLQVSASAKPATVSVYKVYNNIRILKGPVNSCFLQVIIFVPDMNKAFHVSKKTLFKVTFQGGLWNSNAILNEYVHIMVNDYLIIGSRLLPNANQRATMGLGTGRFQTDSIGGYSYVGSLISSRFIVSRTAMVCLPPGTYIFNVGVRADEGSDRVAGGMVTYELTQFENDVDLGDLKLAAFPKQTRSTAQLNVHLLDVITACLLLCYD
ncbi:unnamed protein product [Didymodactylos carnosus]|uniref:Uncharacterized protein n=1 Tax=Didymodactylos carnosus TaxID=1234261 RepID=A0A814CIZ0_9BILA|nr:unnamed protein product [Didymodactylos carnosus]CAF1202568.1 unnamed protein product [Didymodactylos carnosus]CAF3717909.1 unnamed protein product [Didymodactylos carnosus]CAF4012272.1 unnamed protein product [Didymodactylos carnosus]